MIQKAKTINKTFSRETTVNISINADASTIWPLLTNATDFPRWNSTIVSLEGKIKLGKKKLKSMLDEKRTFTLKVKKLKPKKQMVWHDRKGNRIYTIVQNDNG